MRRKAGLLLLCVILTAGITSAEDTINPGKAPASDPSFSEQMVAMWDSFLGMMF